MCSQSALKKETISLPVKSDGNIDFNYMENYIKILKQNIIDNLDQMFYVI